MIETTGRAAAPESFAKIQNWSANHELLFARTPRKNLAGLFAQLQPRSRSRNNNVRSGFRQPD